MEMAKTIAYLLAGIAVHCFNKKNEGKRMWLSRKKFTSIEKKISELERAVQAWTTPEDVKKLIREDWSQLMIINISQRSARKDDV